MQGRCCTESQISNHSNFDCKSYSHRSELLVLVVDSDADNLELTSKVISYYGFSVITATNSQTALEIFQEYQPAIILVEIMLPDVDGIDLGRLVRRTASVPIIALTSLPGHLFHEQALRAGFNGYIEKPFEFETLEHVIIHCLNLKSFPF
ncbi:MAG: response regulator [Calothrix sp. C42_A2020_038]|nr:response regulator [Calothrix sp. C42_A2020_038]